MNLDKLLRENIKKLQPYSSARDEFSGEAMLFLDANENPYNQPYNRYPDPLQRQLKEKIAALKNVATGQIFLGNGSDEPIDLLIRAFCEPGVDSILTIDPTYGMYQVAAGINNVAVKKVPLNEDFQPDVQKILKEADKTTKLVFLCSPNNPSGNSLEEQALFEVINRFEGIVVLDEAYVDFAPEKSLLPRLNRYPNLVILQTFSKAWGMAGIRLGMAFADPEIIAVLNKIKYPYNLNILTQHKALELIENRRLTEEWVKEIIQEREKMGDALKELDLVVKVYPSDANFILVKMHGARSVYEYLKGKGIIVRDRSKVFLCDDSLRITIGSPDENLLLINTLKEFI